MSANRPPRPVFTGRYRYSRWRWRLLVYTLDTLGSIVFGLLRLLRTRPVLAEPGRIVILQLDHLGDGVLTTAMLPGLRAAYPGARIEVLASPSNQAVFESHPDVDAVIVADRNWFERPSSRGSLLGNVWRLGRLVRERRYDLGFDVRGDLLSVLVLALARIPRRVGWAMGGGGFLLTDIAAWEPGRHEVRSRMALLAAVGIVSNERPTVQVGVTDLDRAQVARKLESLIHRPSQAPSTPQARVRSQPQRARPLAAPIRTAATANRADAGNTALATLDRAAGPADAIDTADSHADADALFAGRFGQEAPLLVVHLGAGTHAKRWPIGHWKSLIQKFAAEGWLVIVVGGPEEAELAQALEPHEQLADWTGSLHVSETTALLERADLFIGADSGPAHLAACAGVASVVLFSGTNRVSQWRPWSRRSLVIRRKVACRPCHRKVCPLLDHPCLAGIPPARVHHAAKRWWSRVHHARHPHAPL